MYSNKEYFEKVIDYRKHLDQIILARTAIFCTLNSLLFFVFGRSGVSFSKLVAAFLFAITYNSFWLIVNNRTRNSMVRTSDELTRIEKKLKRNSNMLYEKVIARRGELSWISATAVLCYIIPGVFVLAWSTFLCLGWFDSPDENNLTQPILRQQIILWILSYL